MKLFYTPDIQSNIYELDEIESKHCIKVLRLKEDDIIHLINGKGCFYKAKIINITKKKTTVKIIEKQENFNKRDFYLHIAIAPTKNIERFEWFLEKATEIGIDEITPLLCEHSERKIIKLERLEKILISAMKQSLKAYLPKLNSLIKYTNFVKKSFDGQKFIAHCDDKQERKFLKNTYKTKKNILILIGAEGDFSANEIRLAEENNFIAISLGDSRLRTETAGIVACNNVQLLNS